MLAALLWPASAGAQTIDWQTAVARLAAERTRAETCVGILKRHGDPAQISRGELAYGEAKAEVDAVIGALIVALAEQKPLGDPLEVEQGMSRGVAARDAFCEQAVALLPPTSGEKEGILAGLVEGVAGPLIEAVMALYGEAREDDRLRRKTIETQLEATRWPAFAQVDAMSRLAAALLCLLAGLSAAAAQEPAPGLYDRPVLVLEPGHAHGADQARRCRPRGPLCGDRLARQDGAGLVGGGRQAAAHHPPAGGPGDVGKVYAVAISPDGALIAAGGWTRRTEADPQEQIYLFDRATGEMVARIAGPAQRRQSPDLLAGRAASGGDAGRCQRPAGLCARDWRLGRDRQRPGLWR